jgi:ketosteroid isomerase-like protein
MRCIVNNGRTFILVALILGLLIAAATHFGQTYRAIAGAEAALNKPFSKQAVKMDKKYTETEAENLKKVKDAFEAWKKGTGSPYQLLDDNVSWTIVGNSLASKEYTGRKAFIDEVITPFNARMSKPLVPTIRNIYADRDTVIVLFDAEGTAKDGKIYANTYSWFLQFKNGRIDRAIAFFESIHFNELWTRVSIVK